MLAFRRAVAALAVSAANAAPALEVIPVPWVATDPAVPHAAYSNHATTFKAIARGGNGTYLFEWDFQGDGVFDFAATTTNRYNLSTRFTYPYQASETTFLAVVRVTSGGETALGSYPVRVFADVPADPGAATDRQLQIMRNVAIDDGLWFLHNQLTRSGNEADPLVGAQITGNVGTQTTLTAGAFLEALGMNLHFPAFPAAYLGEMPDPAANAERWAADPYAEDAARLVNYLLSQGQVVNVFATDEVNTAGFYPEVALTPILGTDDGIGIYVGANAGDQTTGYHSSALRGLALASLTGYVAQVGDSNRILGRRFEHVVQQMVDALVWAQNECGYVGSWYYTPNSCADMLGEYAGGTLDAAEALVQAERSMGGAGVVVPNLARARLLYHVLQNQNACPEGGYGGSYSTSYNGVCDFAQTAAHVVAYGWAGANLWSASDGRLAFPSYNGLTRGQLRTAYEGTRAFIDPNFSGSSSGSFGWDRGFVEGGDFTRTDGRGDHWSMLHWTRAARTVQPEIVLYGTNDHARLFARYLLGNQGADGGFTSTQTAALGNYNDQAVGPSGSAAWALIVLSRDGMAPVASATVLPALVSEGTPVTLDGSAFAGGAEYAWELGDGETRTGQHVEYAYRDNGIYNATLTVSTAGGSSSQTTSVTVQNVAPVADAGPDLVVSEGSAASLSGSLADAGAGDTHVASWTFGDGESAATIAAAHAWADDGTYVTTLTVTDDDGGVGSDAALVTVVNVAPTITSTPPATSPEGPFAYTVAFTDPGAGDTHECTAPVKPAGATLTGCTVSWTPTFAQLAAPSSFTACVADDDGGSACQSFALTVDPVDADADGLPDAWETHFFGGTGAESGAGDADLDGVTNADELLAGSDPTSWDGPGVPVLLSPACSTKVATAQPWLLVANAEHPGGAPLTYELEVHSDAAATSLVAAGHAVPAGAGYTAWQVDVPLEEDGTYYWRARAGDGAVFGAWTAEACTLIVDAVAPPPPAAGPEGPAGPTGPAGEKGGCGSAPAGASSWPALLVLVGLALRSRWRSGLARR